MKTRTILEMIAANREYLLQNSSMALNMLSTLHKDFDQIEDEGCIISLALNDSTAYLRYDAAYDKALQNSQRIVDTYPDSAYKTLLAYHHKLIGRCYVFLGRYAEGAAALTLALDTANQNTDSGLDNIKVKSDILHDLAMCNDKAGGESSLTTHYLNRALDLIQNTPFEGRKAICMMGLGIVEYNNQAYQAAREHYFAAARIFEDEFDYSNLASAWNNIGLSYRDEGILDQSETYLTKALDLRLRQGNKIEIAIMYCHLGELYETQKEDAKALAAMLACRDHCIDALNKDLYAHVLSWLEKHATERNDQSAAERFRAELATLRSLMTTTG